MTLSLIVAMTEDRVIGRNNQLPWHISEDLVRFKQLTMGHPIIMGRKTFESIGKPLPGRTNIVVTRNGSFARSGVSVTHSFQEALHKASISEGSEEIFVIGGAALFAQILPLVDKLYLTLVHHKILGDVLFPPFDYKRDFKVIEESQHQSAKGEKLNYSVITGIRHGHN